jgi:SAM-dependent methyltransferase
MGKIEILSVSLLASERRIVEEIRVIKEKLNIPIGWHYLLDLSWAARQLSFVTASKIMDAGAGCGIMQWYLAERGTDVISVDARRRLFAKKIKTEYKMGGTTWMDRVYVEILQFFLKITNFKRDDLGRYRNKGTVFIYNKDLLSMPDIRDDSLDAVVSISALEHNPPHKLRDVVAELMRKLKPGGLLIATLAASKYKDWFHEPSKGWCYTEASLRDLFQLSAECPSNYREYDELFDALKNCSELREDLSPFYYRSGNNGMPWGIWAPGYQPVGVVKEKHD